MIEDKNLEDLLPNNKGSYSREFNNVISQNPAIWWSAFIDLCNNIKDNFDIGSITKISVNGTSGTVLLTNIDGEPLSNAIMYNELLNS